MVTLWRWWMWRGTIVRGSISRAHSGQWTGAPSSGWYRIPRVSASSLEETIHASTTGGECRGLPQITSRSRMRSDSGAPGRRCPIE